ncbi:MAG: hypothetical protein ACOVO3_04155 [Fluviicola sp.]
MDIKDKIVAVEQLPVETITTKRFRREFQIYPWIKSRIFHKVIMGSEVLQEKDSSVLRTQLRSLFYGFFSFFRKYDAWAFTNSSERVLLDGKQFDKLMDPITQAYPMRMLLVELQLFKQFKRKEVASKHVVSRAWIVFLEELYMRVFLRKVTFSGKPVLEEVEGILNDKVPVEPIIRKYLAQYRVMKGILWLLPKPKVVFLTVSYANFGYIRAWKEAGIHVVEMQHGLIGDGHYGYIYHKRFNPDQFPDSVLVFGERDQELFQSHSVFPARVMPVGRYMLDYFKEKAVPNITPVRTILVSLQDTHWSEVLLKFILEVDHLEPNRFNWVIQPRRTPESVYRQQFDLPQNMVFSQVNVYEAMGKADAHLTIFSTTAIESISIGKPTFLYNYDSASQTYLGQFLSSNPNAYFCDDAAAFLSACNKLVCKDKDEISASNNANIRADYHENMSGFMKNLMHEVAKK